MRRRQFLIVLVAIASVFLPIAGWALTYPSPDPKSIPYVLWKAGFPTINLDLAADLMIGDRGSDKIVIGKTKEQLRQVFGYLTTLDNASPYLRGCYKGSAWEGKDVLFIRQSPWMVVFEGDEATQLVLIKGC